MGKTYIVVKDLQGTDFNIGFKGTSQEFKEHFSTYLTEEHKLEDEKLNKLDGVDAINYISNLFELEIVEEI